MNSVQREQTELALRKSPDFLLTAANHNRERMERLLEKLPAFRMWRRLSRPLDTPALLPAASQDLA